jgi:hypothetical protein
VLTVDRPMLDRSQVVAAVTIVSIADLAGFHSDRDPVLYPTGFATLSEQARRLFTRT